MTRQGQVLERRDRIGLGQRLRIPGGQSTPAPSESGERFAAYVAHELRTPMATRRALLELALADGDADLASWREIGEDVLTACKQQEHLLDACLTLARSHSGLLRCEPVDLAAITAEALDGHGLGKLECVVVLTPGWTTGDPGLLERLAGNLVSNAVRHNIVGGRIEVETRTESGRAVLAIANTGPLIPAAEVTRLFEPFQQLASPDRRAAGGFGLGLAVAKAVADAHDAFITAHARPAGGLRVEVAFPPTNG